MVSLGVGDGIGVELGSGVEVGDGVQVELGNGVLVLCRVTKLSTALQAEKVSLRYTARTRQ